jgi:hypothetical protein
MREEWTYEPSQLLMDYRSVAAKSVDEAPENLTYSEKFLFGLFHKYPKTILKLWHELEIGHLEVQAAMFQAKAASLGAKAASLNAESQRTERHERIRRNQPLRRLNREERMRWRG